METVCLISCTLSTLGNSTGKWCYAELAKGINGASNGDNTPFLRSIDSRLARLLEWAEQLDLNSRLFVGDREIYNAAERGRKGSGAVIVRV